jgi:mRNA-degrading endonuclease toxin of MazEF toxin-antitoxin module
MLHIFVSQNADFKNENVCENAFGNSFVNETHIYTRNLNPQFTVDTEGAPRRSIVLCKNMPHNATVCIVLVLKGCTIHCTHKTR